MRHSRDISVISSVDSSVLNFAGSSVPELNVLRSNGAEFVLVVLAPADVVNLVGVSLVHKFLLTRGSVEYVDTMVGRHVDTSKLTSVAVEPDALEAISTLVKDSTSLLLSSDSIPDEDHRDRSTLSGDSVVSKNVDAHDVVVVTVHLTSGFSSTVFNFTSTEEFLGVTLGVEDDTESSGHVDNVSCSVEVNVLARVSTSVSVNVLEGVRLITLLLVRFSVFCGLLDGTDPRLGGLELLTNSLVRLFEETSILRGSLARLAVASVCSVVELSVLSSRFSCT